MHQKKTTKKKLLRWKQTLRFLLPISCHLASRIHKYIQTTSLIFDAVHLSAGPNTRIQWTASPHHHPTSPQCASFLVPTAYRAPAATHALHFYSPGTWRDPWAQKRGEETEWERKKAPLGGRGLQPITSAGPLSSGARSVLIVHVPPYQTSQSIQRCTAGFIVFCIVSSPPCTGKKKKIQNSLSLPLFFFLYLYFFFKEKLWK